MTCPYCGFGNHAVAECPERLEEYHGLPSDHFDDEEGEETRTDGGVERARPNQGEQADLSEFVSALEIDRGDVPPEWAPTSDDSNPSECQNCGQSVTLQFRRVFGDRDNVVYGCPDCMTYRQLKDGGAAKQ